MGALPYDLRRHHLRGQEGRLIPLLQEAQREDGFLRKARLAAIGRETGVPLSQVYGVASFYAQFRYIKPGKHMVKICLGTACHVCGATGLVDSLERELHIKEGETTKDANFSLETVRCFGSCALAPVVVVDEEVYGNVTSPKALDIVKKYQ